MPVKLIGYAFYSTPRMIDTLNQLNAVHHTNSPGTGGLPAGLFVFCIVC